MTPPDIAAIADAVQRGRIAASDLQQKIELSAEDRHIQSAKTIARSAWKTLRTHERDLMDWLDDNWPKTPPSDDQWIAVLGLYELVVNVLVALAQAGKDAS